MIAALLLAALLIEPATPNLDFRTSPAQHEAPAYWANYMPMFAALNLDRQQTLTLNSRGFYEMNPLLGRHPSATRVNLYFAADIAIPLLLSPFPDWFKTSAADTVTAWEERLIAQNTDLRPDIKSNPGWPICIVFSIRADWDRLFENKGDAP